MGGAIARGLVANPVHSAYVGSGVPSSDMICTAGSASTGKAVLPSDIVCTARSAGTLQKFAELGFNVTTDNVEAVKGADIVIFAVKPWLMEEVVHSVAKCLDLGHLNLEPPARLSSRSEPMFGRTAVLAQDTTTVTLGSSLSSSIN